MKQIIKSLQEYGLQTNIYTTEQIEIILKKFADWFPFENLDVMCRDSHDLNREFLQTKLFEKRRGGLCYEINALLFYTLKELGYDVMLGSGTVNNNGKWALAGTHVMVLLNLDGQRFLVDGGFGNKLALVPLEIDGETAMSAAGTFRAITYATKMGSIALQSLSDEGEWILHYAFDWEPLQWNQLNEIRDKIHHHPHSPFNKQLIIANITEKSTTSLNEERYVRNFADGGKEISQFTKITDMLPIIRSKYSSAIAKKAESYLHLYR